MLNKYDPTNPIFESVEAAAVFYANLAKSVENDLTQSNVFQTSCETAAMLLRLNKLEENNG